MDANLVVAAETVNIDSLRNLLAEYQCFVNSAETVNIGSLRNLLAEYQCFENSGENRMDVDLAKAAKTGNVKELHNLMAGDPFLLKPAELTGGENPLHIACMNNHAEFVKQMLYYRLDFAKELNRDGFSPLHIASAYGHLEIVRELLKVGSHLCLVKGKDGRIPLHYAVMEGKINVIDELLSASLRSIAKLTVAKETCFHIAIKYDRVEALKFLMNRVQLLPGLKCCMRQIVNWKDDQGNSILHLTAFMEKYEILRDLLRDFKPLLYINSRNMKSGLTPLDILVSKGASDDTLQMLRLVRAKEAKDIRCSIQGIRFATKPFHKYNIACSRFPGESKNWLLVVVVLIVTATYQSMMNPPGGVWQGPDTDNNATKAAFAPKPGHSVMAIQNPTLFSVFLIFNSLGFFSSLFMLIILIGRYSLLLPINVSLIALLLTYISCILFFKI